MNKQKDKIILTEEQLKRISWLKENKCKEPNCYNLCLRGYIYCEGHLYGFPRKMDVEDILLLNIDEEHNGKN